MDLQTHHINGTEIAELSAEGVIIRNVQDALDLIGNVYFQGFECVIIHRHNLTDDFFDLKNKLAGEILQKFSNYRIRLAIVGDFSEFTGKSIRDFIFESNNGKQVNFLPSTVEAIQSLSK